jgi:hypothetical protein
MVDHGGREFLKRRNAYTHIILSMKWKGGEKNQRWDALFLVGKEKKTNEVSKSCLKFLKRMGHMAIPKVGFF